MTNKNMTLIDFLIALGTDAEALRRYQQDRGAALEAAGLSEEDKALLLRGNSRQLKAAIVALGSVSTGHAHQEPGPSGKSPLPLWAEVLAPPTEPSPRPGPGEDPEPKPTPPKPPPPGPKPGPGNPRPY